MVVPNRSCVLVLPSDGILLILQIANLAINRWRDKVLVVPSYPLAKSVIVWILLVEPDVR